MFERSADAILLLDTSINKFVEYNQAALDMLRCSREELSVLHPSELSPPRQPDGADSFSAANERIATAVREGSHRFEWIHKSPHRGDFPVEVLLTPIQAGSAPVLLVVWRDITERKRHEEALRQTQKLESLGVLAGGIAHDFNNLLTAMSGHLSVARAAVGGEHPAKEPLRQMDRVVEKAAALAHQLLAYSGQGALHVETVDLNRAALELVELLGAAAAKGVRLVFEPAGQALPVEANPVELQQVIMNLVTNAAEASAPGGVVKVRACAVTLDARALEKDFTGQPLRPGRHAMLEVVDEGCGMSLEVQSRIFDPFFSTKGAGRGLGLSALSGIVRSHRGGLRIQSAQGAGTTFTVVFPESERLPAPAPAASPPRLARGEGQVLLADDHPAVRISTRALLQAMGFSVLEAKDGQAAVETYRQHLGRIRWVLMDLTMPGVDGHRAFLEIRAMDPQAKVLLSSGWAQSELAARFRADPPLAFLPKPYRSHELEAVLRRVGLL